MGFKTAFPFLLLLGITYASVEVNMNGTWKENTGWEMVCLWTVDSRPLQSVRLYKDDEQFLIYRPEKQGPRHRFRADVSDTRMTVFCHDLGRTGKCVLTLELLSAPVFPAKYKCEVSEEGPRFDMQHAEYGLEVFVAPSYPQMEVSSVEGIKNVNCSSAGIPAPRLVWRIGEQWIPENFSNRRWDTESKLWHSSSVVSISQPEESLVLTCKVISARKGSVIDGQTSEVFINSAGNVAGGAMLLTTVLSLVALLR